MEEYNSNDISVRIYRPIVQFRQMVDSENDQQPTQKQKVRAGARGKKHDSHDGVWCLFDGVLCLGHVEII